MDPPAAGKAAESGQWAGIDPQKVGNSKFSSSARLRRTLVGECFNVVFNDSLRVEFRDEM